jgi:hypothetical protein
MLNKVAGYWRSFYLCPTENESISVSAEELLDKQKHYTTSKRDGRKNFKIFQKRVAG